MIYQVNGETVNVVVADDMPVGMPEHVWRNPDSTYTIKLNASYNYETLLESFLHAIGHIVEGDFDKDATADEIEAEAHRRDANYYVVVKAG
jgi:hypothetical protein